MISFQQIFSALESQEQALEGSSIIEFYNLMTQTPNIGWVTSKIDTT